MRILLVTDWNRGRGGAEDYFELLRDGLRAAGDEVRLLTSSAGAAADGAAEYVAYGTERVTAQVFLQVVNPSAVACIRRALREFQPDVALVNMFAHHLSPAAILALGDLPLMLLVSDYKCVCPLGSKLLPDGSLCREKAGLVCWRHGCIGALHWMRDQPRYALIRSVLRRAHRVVTCSDWMRDELARHGIGAQTLLLTSRGPGADFRRQPSAHPLFLFAGRLDREKGVELLLRAFARVQARLPSARLRVAGRGPLRASLEDLARALGLTEAVEFCGWLSQAEFERELGEAWALVVPSLWAEPLGLVAVQAVIRGVPVVASASGGLAEVVEHGVTGRLFPNGDEEALVEQLVLIAQREVFPHQTLPRAEVTRVAERFGPALNVEAVQGILASLVSAS